MGATWKEKRTENLVTVNFQGHQNQFYIFGGRDESSASLIQGITFAGVLLDEVALMPKSFVEQACARCSVAGSRLWFNCNPAGPNHWFYKEWVQEAEKRNCLRLHFTMKDNPSLTDAIRAGMNGCIPEYLTGDLCWGNGRRQRAEYTTSLSRIWSSRYPVGHSKSGTFPAITAQ